jgi:hypothetical protein
MPGEPFTMMLRNPDVPLETRHIGDVTLARHWPDFNDLAWSTLQHLLPLGSSQGPDSKVQAVFRYVIRRAPHFGLGTVFANPAFVVQAPALSRAFLREARQSQLAWFKQLGSVLGSAGRMKRAMRAAHPIIRQLAYTGVMVVAGKHVWPNQWPKPPAVRPPSPERDLAGQAFGNLTVVAMLPGGRCECVCKCGRPSVVMRKHLLSGGTKSCGCLKASLDARRQTRKRNRAWIHTGELLPERR